MLPFLGRGIFLEDGHAWKRSRDLIKPLFKRAELSDVEGFAKFVDRMFALIPRDGTTVDLQPLFQKLVSPPLFSPPGLPKVVSLSSKFYVSFANFSPVPYSSTEFIFGESVNSLLDTSRDSQEFLDAFSQSLIGAGRRGNLAGGKLGFLYMFDKTWEKSYTKVHTFIDRFVARVIAATDLNNASEKRSEDQPQRYVLIYEMAKEIRDPVALRFEVLNIFFPARDTTGIALSNTVFHLARNPQIWTELRSEALALGDKPLTFETIKSLHSFRYVLFEGIRLQGPSGRTQRVAVRDTVLPCGGGPDGSSPVFVPKGTIVALNNFPNYHDKEFWGDDVEEFKPSRFEGMKYTWEFTPFMGGPRICPANQQVITQAVYLLVRLVREFETIENRDECIEYVEMIKMLCESRNGVKVALYPAKEV